MQGLSSFEIGHHLSHFLNVWSVTQVMVPFGLLPIAMSLVPVLMPVSASMEFKSFG